MINLMGIKASRIIKNSKLLKTKFNATYRITPKGIANFGVIFLCLTSVLNAAPKKAVTAQFKKSAATDKKTYTKPLPRKDNSSGLNVHSLGVGVGQTFLVGGFDDNGRDKITADLYYNYKASHSFDFNVNLHSSVHEINNTKSTLNGLAFAIKGKAYQFDAFSPFALAGLGFYQPSQKRIINGVLVKSDEEITFGVHFGAGADLQLNKRVTVGLIGHYHNPFDVKQDNSHPDVEGAYFKLLLTSYYNF